MPDKDFEGISLPGVELNYPKSWPGTWVVISICSMIAFVSYLFFVEADKDIQQSIVGIVPSGQYQENLKLKLLVESKNKDIANLTRQVKGIQIQANKDTSKGGGLKTIQPLVAETLKTAKDAENKTTDQISQEDVIKSLATSQLHKSIVKYFLENKSWLGNHYWVTFDKIIDDNKNTLLKQYSREDISLALLQLMDIRAIYIQSNSMPPRYGLNNGPLLSKYVQFAAL